MANNDKDKPNLHLVKAGEDKPTRKNNSKNYDWTAIEQEYITTEQTLSALAKKYEMSNARIARESKAGGWAIKKAQFITETNQKALVQKQMQMVEIKSQIDMRHFDLWNRLLDVLQKMFDGNEFYNKGLKQYSVAKMQVAAEILFKAQNGQRLAAGLIEARFAKALEIDLQKLELDKKKAEPQEEPEADSSNFYDALLKTAAEAFTDENESTDDNAAGSEE